MTDQQQNKLLEITGQDLALLLKQTILTFCQMNVAYRNKIEVVGSIHIKADEVEISSFLLQENCLNSGAATDQKTDDEFDNLEDALKDSGNGPEAGEKMEDTFCIVDANGEEDEKSEKEGKAESDDNESKKDVNEDADNMDTETSNSKDAERETDCTENETGPSKESDDKDASENSDKTDPEKETEEETDKRDESTSTPPAPQASIAKQLTGASLSTVVSSSLSAGPRPVTLMVNGTHHAHQAHQMIRAGMPMMRHSTVSTSTSSMPITNSAMGPRIPMPHAAMVAAMGGQMAFNPHPHMYFPHSHGHVPRAAHLSARAAIESIYRQNPPLTNRTINLAASGAVMRHPSMAAARNAGAIMRHPQMAGIHMLPRPAGGLVCPLCMVTLPSQDQYLRHLSTHQRAGVF